MRTYKVFCQDSEFIIHADEIEFRNDFFRETICENLVFFHGKRIVAIFKNWINLIDLGEYLPLQTIVE
jgi:hypothetical protein